jgi:hypothetical protein
MLNYLAPAALTWWVESETYSMESSAFTPTDEHDATATTGWATTDWATTGQVTDRGTG